MDNESIQAQYKIVESVKQYLKHYAESLPVDSNWGCCKDACQDCNDFGIDSLKKQQIRIKMLVEYLSAVWYIDCVGAEINNKRLKSGMEQVKFFLELEKTRILADDYLGNLAILIRRLEQVQNSLEPLPAYQAPQPASAGMQ